jgi:hypothetical protein
MEYSSPLSALCRCLPRSLAHRHWTVERILLLRQGKRALLRVVYSSNLALCSETTWEIAESSMTAILETGPTGRRS